MQTEAAALIEKLLKASRIGFRAIWVGRSGTVMVTFHSIAAARKGAVLFSDFVERLKIGEGYEGKTRVYRVHGFMAA